MVKPTLEITADGQIAISVNRHVCSPPMTALRADGGTADPRYPGELTVMTRILTSIICLMLAGLVAQPATASADTGAVQLRAKSTIVFNDSPDGTRRITGKVWVPKGGQLGVYGQNTNRWGSAYLDFTVVSEGRREITGQFWRVWEPTGEYFLREDEIVNKRVVNGGDGNNYYIIATCDRRTTGDCDGSFTVSSWY